MKAWRSATVNPSGRRSLVFNPQQAMCRDAVIRVQCGRCIRCRLARAYSWAARCVHEASLYEDNIFITLTYDDDHLPSLGSLHYPDFQNFMKRLRNYSEYRRGRSFKYYMCGEYGEEVNRPHYHALLFDFKFHDQKPVRLLDSSYPHWKSDTLSEIWGKGLVDIGTVTQDSAQYVASYCTKIFRSDDQWKVDLFYGGRSPEFGHMSQGLGLKWLDRFHSDVYNHDAVVMKGGAKMRPPRYYDSKYELLYPNEAEVVFAKRRKWRTKRDESWRAYCAREEITRAHLSQRSGKL